MLNNQTPLPILCCIGHITLDKVVTPEQSVSMPGGTAFYFANAMLSFDDIHFHLTTAVAESESQVVENLRQKGVAVQSLPTEHSVYFENIYGENRNNRTQRVLAKARPFTVDSLKQVDANIYHLGSLLADDFPLETLQHLAAKGLVSVDSQGYLREVRGTDVHPVDWAEKKEALQYIHFLKVNEHEMEVLTGTTHIRQAAEMLYQWGVKEVIITLGDLGSVIYDGENFYQIPAYKPHRIVDATGCGDTYMTGYLYQRSKGEDIETSGKFAAAMSSIKMECMGPFSGKADEIYHCIESAPVYLHDMEL